METKEKQLPAADAFQHPYQTNQYDLLKSEIITPALAEWLLVYYNPRNRPESRINTLDIATSIKNGFWAPRTGNLIRFDWSGNLLDGTHRLTACVISGQPIETGVAVGLDPAVMSEIDANKPRNLQTRWALGGSDDVDKNSIIRRGVITAIVRVWGWQESGWKSPMRGRVQEIESFYNAKKEFIDFVLRPREENIVRAGFRSACAQYIEKDPNKGKEFFLAVTGDGAGLPQGSPILALRKFFPKQTHKGNRIQQRNDWYVTATAINAYHAGEEIKHFNKKGFATSFNF